MCNKLKTNNLNVEDLRCHNGKEKCAKIKIRHKKPETILTLKRFLGFFLKPI